jgi:hypothetical protein
MTAAPWWLQVLGYLAGLFVALSIGVWFGDHRRALQDAIVIAALKGQRDRVRAAIAPYQRQCAEQDAELDRVYRQLKSAEEAFTNLSDRFAVAVGVAYRAGASEMAEAVKEGRDPDEVLAAGDLADDIRQHAGDN